MKAKTTLQLLRSYESRNVTFMEADGSWPIVWERACGVHVWDAGGRKYLDLTAAFGVAAAGHANPRVVRAGQKQMGKLMHAMGDVHPHALKAQLARELSRLTFEKWTGKAGKRKAPGGKVIFCNSGFEAVEAALKTAMLATGKQGVIAFEGAYHGLGYGALNATHREHFRAAFRKQLGGFTHFVPFPNCDACSCDMLAAEKRGPLCGQLPSLEKHIRRLFQTKKIGAILVEPIQVRGGINSPSSEFLPMLRRLCDEFGALLIVDEIFTGFGRTGRWFACEWSHEWNHVIPDLICLGKALTGGFPLSACVGKADLMDRAWPESTGEAIHTSTYLGHPVGCAMALAQIAELRSKRLVDRCGREFWTVIPAMLNHVTRELPEEMCRFRGNCLLAGLELLQADGGPATEAALHIIKRMLHRGFILLPEGEHSNIISFTPPLTITKAQLWRAIQCLGEELRFLRS